MYNGAFLEDLEAFFDGKCYSAADLICFLFFVFCFFKSTSFRNNSQRNEENSAILHHTVACSHIFFSEQNIVSPSMTSRANSSHSPLYLGRKLGKGQFFEI